MLLFINGARKNKTREILIRPQNLETEIQQIDDHEREREREQGVTV